MKLFSLCILFACMMGNCQKKPYDHKNEDFEILMGSALPAWEHVQTREDHENLAFFREVYEKNIALLQGEASELKIPKVIHFIWLGPKAFPRESIENVRSWIAKNSDWQVKFWTDRARPLPHPSMELCYVKDFPFQKLEKQFHESDNYAEKSDILRIEILHQQGGVYVDHDVKCKKGFDPLHGAYDFYCGMELPYATTLSSSVLPTNNILGAKPGHLLLDKMMDWLTEHWDQIERDYPGKDRDAVINRVSHRTFLVLGENFKQFSNQTGNVDIALPTYFFNSPKEDQAIFAQHQYKGTWFENETEFEKMARKRLMMLSKKVNKLLLALGVLGGMNVLGFSMVGILMYKMRAAR